MKLALLIRLSGALLIVFAGRLADAQDSPRPYIDFSVGANWLMGNTYVAGRYRFNADGSVFLTLGTQAHRDRSFLMAVHLGNLGWGDHDDICYPAPDGGCKDEFPLTGILAVTVGGRPITSPLRALELTAGPAYINTVRGSSIGVLVSGRVGVPPGSVLSPGLMCQVVVAPTGDRTLFVAGFGASLRIW